MTKATMELPTWDLSDLYNGVDDPRLDADLAALTERAAAFERKYKGTIACATLDAAHLSAVLDEYEAFVRAQSRPMTYAALLFSTDTTDPRRGALLQKTREAASAMGAHLVFFDLEIGSIPPATYDAIVGHSVLAPYRHYLGQQRALAAHYLTEPEEKVLVETANCRGSAFRRLFTEVTSRTKYQVRLGDQVKEMTQSEALALLYDPDRAVRQAASTAIAEGLQGNAHACTFIYNTLIHEKDVLDRLRKYPSPEASRHLENELSEEIINTVSDVVAFNYGIVAEYYKLKKRLLGLDELMHYDRYAPVGHGPTQIGFNEAKDLVLEAFGRFSPRLADMIQPFFSKRWIDAALADGKEGGAYCAGIAPDHHPYVFMNYTGKPRDVMTLAHELGHGVHDVLASRQHALDYYPVLPMAETASTFGEILVFNQLQATLSSRQERLALLCGKIEDTFATVFRQIAMYRFEQQAHRARRAQGELPTEAYSQMWQTSMQAMFGDSLTLGDEHKWYWLYIPHIVDLPFYVYAYAYGELLVLSLYAQYQREGAAFVDKYFNLLAAGGSRPPTELVAAMGFNIADPAFWQGGCDLIKQSVEQAKALAG
jgi:oligoendopeptidase F